MDEGNIVSLPCRACIRYCSFFLLANIQPSVVFMADDFDVDYACKLLIGRPFAPSLIWFALRLRGHGDIVVSLSPHRAHTH